VPVGVFLSGGVDSSLVSAYVARHAPALEAFTVAYRASPGSDESGYAMRAAAGVGIRQHLCNLEGESVLSSFLEMLEYLDEPMADAAIIPLYFVAKFAREKVTVVLSGDGGDELFAGYGKHAAQVWLERLGPVRGALQAGKRWFRRGSAARKLAACATLPFAARQFLFGSGGPTLDEAATLMGQGDLLVGDVFEDALACDAAFRQKDVLNRSLYLDCRILLPDGYLVKADRATMANSLEMRNPLLDRALAEFAFSIPGGFKMRMGQTKRILKRLAARHVDRSCVYRRKSGFMSPLSHWTRHELRDLTEDSVAAAADLLDAGRVRRLLRDHMDGRLDARFVVLRLLNLGFFLKRWARGG
jgi:asparagine synthase (glutamine-hydrolysing)